MGTSVSEGEREREGEKLTDAVDADDLVDVLQALARLDLEEDEHAIVRAGEVVERGHAGAPRELRERVPEPAHALRREARGGGDGRGLRAGVHLLSVVT